MLQSLFVDFNSYFASVEQELRPELRGQAMAVLPVLADSTCCIAASYEAKKFGIFTGTRVSEARERCPGIQLVVARPAVYVEYHHKLIAAVESCIHVEEVCSIDEMVCSLTGQRQGREEALAVARQIKEKIACTVGSQIKCSIGLAPNHFLAKTATDMQKPDGLVVIEMADLPHCLHRLKLRDLCGIGRNMEVRLLQHGIQTVEQLCAASKTRLRQVWGGVEGDRFYEGLHGEKTVRPLPGKSVIGHSHVLEPPLRSRDLAFGVLHGLLQKAAMRMRKIGYLSGALHLSVKFVGTQRWSQEIRFTETDDTIELVKHMRLLWETLPPDLPPPLTVGVNLFHLVAASNVNRTFFDSDARQRLNRAVDSLNEKFGKDSVHFGASSRETTPMRIAFNRIPEASEAGPPPETVRLMQARAQRDIGRKRPRVESLIPTTFSGQRC